MSQSLQRELRFWDSIAITVGIVIGVGIFRTPSEVAQYLHSPLLILGAWVLGALISLLGVLCYAELSSRHPETGGTYVFLREAYGKFVGFVYGWSEFSINRAASIAAIAYIFATYLRNLIPYAESQDRWVALAAIFVLTWVNILGLRLGMRVQHFLSSFKVLAILVVAGLIFWFSGSTGFRNVFGGQGAMPLSGPSQWAPALIPILWTYGGWHESTFMAGEFRDTRRELPVALIVSALIVAFLYLVLNAAYLCVVPPVEMAKSDAIAASALGKLFGPAGSVVITVAVLVSALGALNSTVLTGGRIPFSVAQDCPGLVWFGRVDPRFKTPLRSLALNGAWASVLVLWGNFEQLLFLTAFEIWLFFILAGLSVLILRGRAPTRSHFSTIGYPAVPILFTLVSAWLCFATIQHAPREALFGFFIILVGVPVYFLVRSPLGSPR